MGINGNRGPMLPLSYMGNMNKCFKESFTHCVLKKNKFTACILEVRHFLQQSLETFRAASSLSHRGAGSGPALGGSWLMPELPSAPIHIALKAAVFGSFSIFVFLYLSTGIIYFRLLYCAVKSAWLGLCALPTSSLVRCETQQ